MTPALLSCPFCGLPANGTEWVGDHALLAYCPRCSFLLTVERWNERASVSSAAARREAFEEAAQIALEIANKYSDDPDFGDDHEAACCYAGGACRVVNVLREKAKVP